MDAVEMIRRLHRHRAWVNGNLLKAAADLNEGQLKSQFAIGQGSIWRSLVHLYAAEYVWLETLQGNEDFLVPGDLPGKLPGNQQGEGGIRDLDDLSQKWSELEERWTGYVAGLSSAPLDEVVYRKSASLGTRLAIRRSDVLLHVCTHAHYTSAQVVNMFRQAGIEKLPESMLISLVRQEGTNT
jgi:uncharacterized damage-inducible protein DinB